MATARTANNVLATSGHDCGILSAAVGQDITLADVPQSELERIAAHGFDGVWLMGPSTPMRSRFVPTCAQDWSPGYPIRRRLPSGIRQTLRLSVFTLPYSRVYTSGFSCLRPRWSSAGHQSRGASCDGSALAYPLWGLHRWSRVGFQRVRPRGPTRLDLSLWWLRQIRDPRCRRSIVGRQRDSERGQRSTSCHRVLPRAL